MIAARAAIATLAAWPRTQPGGCIADTRARARARAPDYRGSHATRIHNRKVRISNSMSRKVIAVIVIEKSVKFVSFNHHLAECLGANDYLLRRVDRGLSAPRAVSAYGTSAASRQADHTNSANLRW
eukprot:COSAG02_NODE_1541_length_12013_cov_16.409182_9_plen_126_part_00